ncbi:sugar phosphate isomerase/epimerase [Actomonas aquatica]|uniref:Sugar phosphate isomerase/epimerase n=1 Tax=Actomonas aquatica TaxID=2866162 RepID=A0ABZ1CD86_9BACT|nr:sugar phosphate isomerase/epimerase [Opitutus sp. WL0086]WRQ89448.1 sugar phosphate isomerase/epimerase [Opitutus sp. WL0086]
MKPTLALSTCWNSYRHTDGYAMLKEIRDLGFDYAELSHGTRIVLVPGILRAVEEGLIQITSTHNFCPLPTGINHSAPNLFEPSNATHKEHDQWLRHTLKSIDFTAQVGASVMVTHLGSVHFFWTNPVRKVKAYRRMHSELDVAKDPGYRKVLEKALAKQRKRMPPYWEQVLASLEEIRERCLEKKVMIACENREKFQELPLDDDFPAFFDAMPEQRHCGYWHDTGHAELKQNMGVISHREHLEKNASRLLGFHLHDVADDDDHQPVGYGQIDFDMISSFWEPHHRLTLELSPRTTPRHVLMSKERVDALVEKRFG